MKFFFENKVKHTILLVFPISHAIKIYKSIIHCDVIKAIIHIVTS